MEKLQENLETIKKVIEDAAGKVAHSTKKRERTNCKMHTRKYRNT